MALIQSGNSPDLMTVDSVSKAGHVTLYDVNGRALAIDTDLHLPVSLKPPAFGILGAYSLAAKTGALAATMGANSPLFSTRWGDSTGKFALIERIFISVNTVGAITAAVATDFDLIFARAFTASDSGGTALTLTGNNAKRRTSMGTSIFSTVNSDMRIASTAQLTAGTRTLDAQSLRISPSCQTPLLAGQAWFGGAISATGAATVASGGPELDLCMWDAYLSGTFHPIILAQNEGFIFRLLSAGPATGTFTVKINFDWMEVAAY